MPFYLGGAGELEFAFVDFIGDGNVEGLAVGAAEGDVVGAVADGAGGGENEFAAAFLVKELHSVLSSTEEFAGGGAGHAVEAAFGHVVGKMSMEVGLLVFKATIGVDGVVVDHVAGEVGHVEAGVIGAESDAVWALEVGVSGFAVAGDEVDVPDFVAAGVGVIEVAMLGDDEVVGGGSAGDDLPGFTRNLVATDFVCAVRGEVESFAVRGESKAVGASGVVGEKGLGAVGGDLVEFVVSHVGEEEGAVGGDFHAFGKAVSLGDEFPIAVGDEPVFGGGLGVLEVGGDGCFAMVLPKPAQGIGKDGAGALTIVTAFIPGVVDFVARPLEGAEHGLVGEEPVAVGVVEVVGAVLEENAQGLGCGFANEGGVVATAADIDVGANGGVDAAKGVGTMPGDGEGTNGSGGGSADGAVVGVGRDIKSVFVL